MTHTLSAAEMHELTTVLSSSYEMDLCGGAVRLITTELPGDAVSVLVRQSTPSDPARSHRMVLIIDLEKPLAHRHARQMISEWRAGFLEPHVEDDGSVDLRPLNGCGDPGKGRTPLVVPINAVA